MFEYKLLFLLLNTVIERIPTTTSSSKTEFQRYRLTTKPNRRNTCKNRSKKKDRRMYSHWRRFTDNFESRLSNNVAFLPCDRGHLSLRQRAAARYLRWKTVFPVTNDVFLYESRGLVPPKERVFQNSWKVGRVHRSVSLAPINSPVYPYAHFLSVIPPKPSLRLLRLMPNIVQQESTRSRGWHTHFCLSR